MMMNMSYEGLSAELIARGTGLSIRQSRRYANEEVQQLQQQLNSSPQN
jgi:DNA-directed RNA polymerase specialized sigma24 family protein